MLTPELLSEPDEHPARMMAETDRRLSIASLLLFIIFLSPDLSQIKSESAQH